VHREALWAERQYDAGELGSACVLRGGEKPAPETLHAGASAEDLAGAVELHRVGDAEGFDVRHKKGFGFFALLDGAQEEIERLRIGKSDGFVDDPIDPATSPISM
jgi:hypothetical protein